MLEGWIVVEWECLEDDCDSDLAALTGMHGHDYEVMCVKCHYPSRIVDAHRVEFEGFITKEEFRSSNRTVIKNEGS